jgi:hypothetical protein
VKAGSRPRGRNPWRGGSSREHRPSRGLTGRVEVRILEGSKALKSGFPSLLAVSPWEHRASRSLLSVKLILAHVPSGMCRAAALLAFGPGGWLLPGAGAAVAACRGRRSRRLFGTVALRGLRRRALAGLCSSISFTGPDVPRNIRAAAVAFR